jgi:flagellar biosynthesis chaperone FliJ
MKTKEQFKQELKSQLYEWQTNLENLKTKVGGVSLGGKLEMNQLLTDLENKIEEGKGKLAELEEANYDNWDMVKADVVTVWATITTAFDDVSSKFED